MPVVFTASWNPEKQKFTAMEAFRYIEFHCKFIGLAVGLILAIMYKEHGT